MQARFVGFDLTTVSVFPLDEFLSLMSGARNDEPSPDGTGRFIFINTDAHDEYHLGLIVTIKSQRRYCEFQASQDSFVINVQDIENDNHHMEFNFFVINKTSNIGLYQYYHQSCSLREGMKLLQRRYNDYLRGKREAYQASLTNAGQNETRARREANRVHKGTLVHSTLVRQESLGEILDELDEIKSLEVDFTTLSPDENSFSQLSGHVTKHRQHFTFQRSSAFSYIKDAIVDAVSNSEPSAGKVYGKDEDGLARIIRITDSPDSFGEYELDEMLGHINSLDVRDFHNSWIIERLVEACEERSEIFRSEESP